jgi:K+-transporting ATPase KdpF subunit
MNATVFLVIRQMNSSTGYAVGAVIALFILVYLIYSLVKPEKF